MCKILSNTKRDVLAAVVVSILAAVLITAGVIFILTNLVAYQGTSPNQMVAENWAGYAVASDLQNPQPQVTIINGSWTVPSVSDIGTDAFSAVWVGIGGQYGHNLIQVGTEQDWTGGSPSYSAWYEALPAESVTINSMQVSPGDQIEASVMLVDSGSNVWLVSIKDTSTGQSFQINLAYDPGRLSGEWIVERPDVNGVTSTLANFGSVTFSNCQATINTAGVISDFQNVKVIMETSQGSSRSVQLADVSGLASGGTQFTVNYITG